MKIWKKALLCMLALVLVVGALPMALAAETDGDGGIPVARGDRILSGLRNNETYFFVNTTGKFGSNDKGLCFDTLSDALKAISLDQVKYTESADNSTDTLETLNLTASPNVKKYGWNTEPKRYYIFAWSKGTATTTSYTIPDDITVGKEVIFILYTNNYAAPDLTFTGNVTIADGGSLFFRSYSDRNKDSSSTITFYNPVKIENGGEWVLQGRSYDCECNTYTFAGVEGSMIEVESGGTVTVESVKLESSSPDPLISTAGDVQIYNLYGPAYTGTNTLVEVKEGGELTFTQGEVIADGVPAITVADGATLVIPANSKAEVTANNNTKAIDLTPGATVKKGDLTVTVGNVDGENYVDNDGNIHLAAGAKVIVDGKETVLSNGGTIYADGTVEAEGTDFPYGVLGGLLPIWGSQMQSPFVDVTAVDYYYDAVNWAVDNGITTGTGRYSFSPDEACTRAQAVTFLWRAAGSPAPKSAATAFVDVDSNAYYAKAVAWAVENDITVGTSATTFSPSETCTRAQIVTFLYRAFGRVTSASATFTDVAADAYYAPAVAWAAANSITGGTGNGKFSPAATCTRAQIVTFLYRCCG